MIYFIEAVNLNHIKIGHTDKPVDRRLATLQTGNSFSLRVLGTVHGSKRDERRYHSRLRASHIRGEWYRRTEELDRVIAKDTKQYGYILIMDKLLGKPLTRRSLRHVPLNEDLFMWRAMYDEVSRRLQAGESKEAIVDSYRLEFDPTSDYYGWYKGRGSRHDYPTYHLFFVKQEKLYRLIGKFINPVFGPGYGHILPRLFGSFPAAPNGVFSVCRQIWEKASPEWQKDAYRFYL